MQVGTAARWGSTRGRGVWTVQTLHGRVQRVATESDPLTAFRNELRARRERKGLNYNEAARLVRPKFSGQRWRELEQRTDTKARRATIIKLAGALGWDPAHALALAGEPSLAPVESLAAPENPRDQLIRLLPELSEARALALLYVARTMIDPAAVVPSMNPVQPGTVHVDHIIGSDATEVNNHASNDGAGNSV